MGRQRSDDNHRSVSGGSDNDGLESACDLFSRRTLDVDVVKQLARELDARFRSENREMGLGDSTGGDGSRGVDVVSVCPINVFPSGVSIHDIRIRRWRTVHDVDIDDDP